jgi:8-oxo-dGTP diphosphatase
MLRVAAAAVIENDRLLLVSKTAAPRVFYLPGGKPEDGETATECIRRELREELGAEPASLEFLETVRAVAALERVPMTLDVFLAKLDGVPAPAAEIASVAWYTDGTPFAGQLAPAIVGGVLPTLRRRSLL